MSPSPAAQLLKGFGLVVYGPSAAYSMVLGALLPVVPVLAHAFSDSVAVAAVAVAMLSIGELVGSLPAGAVIARVGEKRTMILSGLIGLTGVAIIALLPSLAFLFLGGFLVGVGSSAFQLARHAVLTMYTPLPCACTGYVPPGWIRTPRVKRRPTRYRGAPVTYGCERCGDDLCCRYSGRNDCVGRVQPRNYGKARPTFF